VVEIALPEEDSDVEVEAMMSCVVELLGLGSTGLGPPLLRIMPATIPARPAENV